MSSRYPRNELFENAPEYVAADQSQTPRTREEELMLGLQVASDSVMHLATQTHSAVARQDAAAAEAARAALAIQLAEATRLIDAMLDNGDDVHTLH